MPPTVVRWEMEEKEREGEFTCGQAKLHKVNGGKQTCAQQRAGERARVRRMEWNESRVEKKGEKE